MVTMVTIVTIVTVLTVVTVVTIVIIIRVVIIATVVSVVTILTIKTIVTICHGTSRSFYDYDLGTSVAGKRRHNLLNGACPRGRRLLVRKFTTTLLHYTTN